jgi:mannitol/fructose-specific phosphotransferase system IIA component (Ntr-type)
MNLSKYITPKTIKLDLAGSTTEEILSEMVDLLCKAGKLDECHKDDALNALMRREKMMSTGLQNGVAIPHAKTSGVEDLVGAMGIKKGGIDFGALDGKPSCIFVMTLSPKTGCAPHVPFLAEVAKILQDEETCKEIEAAHNTHEIIDIMFG